MCRGGDDPLWMPGAKALNAASVALRQVNPGRSHPMGEYLVGSDQQNQPSRPRDFGEGSRRRFPAREAKTAKDDSGSFGQPSRDG